MFKMDMITATDFYKISHGKMMPKNTTMLYSNFTCRSDARANVLPDFDHKVVNFGLYGICQWMLIDMWNESFFKKPLEEVISKYQRRMDSSLGPGSVGTKHIAALHKLGYLPILIKSLPEGARVNMRVPLYTISNTHPDFAWVTNYLETQLSAEAWKPLTSATTAFEYKRLFLQYAKKTGIDPIFCQFQGHDFSFRGLSGIFDATSSGAAHLTSFWGTDTIPAIDYLEDYYNADTKTTIGCSVPATEHSIMCLGGEDGEIETFRHLIQDLYPKGIISIVSDTWDFWQVITEFTVTLKDTIMARDGKVVIRPDSGDPVSIICGTAEVIDLPRARDVEDAKAWALEYLRDQVSAKTPHGEYGGDTVSGYFRVQGIVYKAIMEIEWNRHDKQYYYMDREKITSFEPAILTPSEKGAIECLWEVFGGTVTPKGYKTLDSHIGLIYGDSISLQRASQILARLEEKGFSSGNVIFGIGSYTYQFVTRDSYGTAIKATYGVVDGESRELFKDPKTDNGIKKSAKGLLRVEKIDQDYILHDQQTTEQEEQGELKPLFMNGEMMRFETLTGIRDRLEESYFKCFAKELVCT